MDKLLKGIGIFLLLIGFLKLVVWYRTDVPISRLSMIYILSMVTMLFIRKKWTYFCLLLILTLLFVGDFYSANYSFHLTPFNYTSSLNEWVDSFDSNLNYYLMSFPRFFSAIVFIILLIPSSRVQYGFQLSKSK